MFIYFAGGYFWLLPLSHQFPLLLVFCPSKDLPSSSSRHVAPSVAEFLQKDLDVQPSYISVTSHSVQVVSCQMRTNGYKENDTFVARRPCVYFYFGFYYFHPWLWGCGREERERNHEEAREKGQRCSALTRLSHEVREMIVGFQL